MKNSDFF